MANYRGQDGSVQFNAQPVGEVQGFNFNSSIDLLDDSVMGDAWKTQVPGMAEWGGTMDVQFDYGDTNGQKAIIDKLITASPALTGTTVQLRISATKYLTGSILISGVEVTSVLGQIVKAKVTFKGTGAPSISWA